MFDQTPKQSVDKGQVGNASTGDILYDGAEKINSNFNNIYNAFGDQRYSGISDGDMNMTIHATGYYQKTTQTNFRTPIELGTQYDVDTSSGAVSPILPKGKRGEGVVFVNFNGSISVTNPLVIQPPSGSIISGLSDVLTVTTPYTRVECWCIADGSEIKWDYSIRSIFGETQDAINETITATTTGTAIPIAHVSQFKTIKLLLTATNSDSTKMRQSEISMLIDSINNKIYHNEYSVLSFGDEKLISVTFSVNVSNNVIMNVKSSIANVKVAVKSIATQRIGVSK